MGGQMNRTKRLLLEVLGLFGLVCAHSKVSRAWRGRHGRDYVRCMECGKCWDSPIQFG